MTIKFLENKILLSLNKPILTKLQISYLVSKSSRMISQKVFMSLGCCTAFHCKRKFDIFKSISTKTLMASRKGFC